MKKILNAGLDYHKNSVQVHVMDQDGKMIVNRSCENNALLIHEVISKYAPDEIRAGIEACCGSANLAEELATKYGWSISLAHPGYVNRMKKTPDKSDFSDSKLLADLTRVGYLPRVWLAPKNIRQLRTVVHYRTTLTDERRATKLRITGLLREERIKPPEGLKLWRLDGIEWLSKHAPFSEQGRWVADNHLDNLTKVQGKIAEAEKRLAEITANDPIVQRLMEMKAIGLVTASILRAEIGHFDRFANPKQLAHFCGLSPRNASSGERQADAGLIQSCNRVLRATIIEAIHRLVRCEPHWRDLAAHLLLRGKPKSKVTAAVGNRWIRWLWHRMVEPIAPAQIPADPAAAENTSLPDAKPRTKRKSNLRPATTKHPLPAPPTAAVGRANPGGAATALAQNRKDKSKSKDIALNREIQ